VPFIDLCCSDRQVVHASPCTDSVDLFRQLILQLSRALAINALSAKQLNMNKLLSFAHGFSTLHA
jgi:hypothetical protein